MGFSAIAGHLILLIALFSAGVLLASAINDSASGQIDARADFVDRLRVAANEDIDFLSGGYRVERCVDDEPPPGCQGTLIPESTFANFTNNGSREIELDEVTVLFEGEVNETDTLAVFRVRENTTSDLWMPGETLEIRVDYQGDGDVTVVGPHGTRAYRRA